MAKTKSKYPTSFETYEEFKRIFQSIPEEDRLKWSEYLTKQQLLLADGNKWSVAHELLNNKILTKELTPSSEKKEIPEFFFYRDGTGFSILHSLALNGFLPEIHKTKDILREIDFDGYSIAHCLADSGTLPERLWTANILCQKDAYNWTVGHSIIERMVKHNEWSTLTPKLLRVYCGNECYVSDIVSDRMYEMSASRLETVLEQIQEESLIFMETASVNFKTAIKKELDRRAEKTVFESQSGIKDSIFTKKDDTSAPAFGGQEELYKSELER